ncbi:universal stress protein [Neorhizobium lilium]|uniref:Universal stress protein n=1 Tax=Neorhizobium lilium TaxID=2503024 RepID=A0A3S4UPR7_9HYPH|nr:universal stress protein [Neorhizobium lilium]RWX78313.1 universal stress protein [Neorhizobium lilium]
MTYKTILAILDTPQNARQISDFGVAVASQFSAHLIGCHAETLSAMPLIAPMEIPDPAAIQVLQEVAQKETAEVKRVFELHAEGKGVPTEWRSFLSAAGYSSNPFMESARAADLIIASQSDPSHSDHRADLETFLFDSGRPLLLVPHAMTQLQPIRRVMIAWNGSREAARATFDSLPFLQAAESVEILVVDPPERSNQTYLPAGAEIANSLSRHGVNASVTNHESSGGSPAAVIEARLSGKDVDLLVMGGYGHSRWWEMIFGGVTRNILDSMTALTLLSR